MKLLASLIELLLAIFILGYGLQLGWNNSPDKEFPQKVPIMFGILISTLPPVGLALYLYYWERDPKFSSACGKQALLGSAYLIVFRFFGYLYPPDTW